MSDVWGYLLLPWLGQCFLNVPVRVVFVVEGQDAWPWSSGDSTRMLTKGTRLLCNLIFSFIFSLHLHLYYIPTCFKMFISPNLQVTLMFSDALSSTRVLQLCVWGTGDTWLRYVAQCLGIRLITRFIECSKQCVKTEPHLLMSPQDQATCCPDCEHSSIPTSPPCGSLRVPSWTSRKL